MPTQRDADAAMAQVGYNVLDTVGRAIGAFAFGINPVALGYSLGSLGSALGGGGTSSPWRLHERTTVHQN